MVNSAIMVEVRRYLRDFQWQRGYHELIAREGQDLEAMVDYVLQNPLRAGLVSAEVKYPYSGAVDRWR